MTTLRVSLWYWYSYQLVAGMFRGRQRYPGLTAALPAACRQGIARATAVTGPTSLVAVKPGAAPAWVRKLP